MASQPVIMFDEPKCSVGGTLCPAWSDWFDACVEADPNSIEEDRDPILLDNFVFVQSSCKRPEACLLHASCKANPRHLLHEADLVQREASSL